jgi:hypothetical protein
MVIIRHPRHRTGEHTDAVTTSSGTPGPPIITAYSIMFQYEKAPNVFTFFNVTRVADAQSTKRCAKRYY